MRRPRINNKQLNTYLSKRKSGRIGSPQQGEPNSDPIRVQFKIFPNFEQVAFLENRFADLIKKGAELKYSFVPELIEDGRIKIPGLKRAIKTNYPYNTIGSTGQATCIWNEEEGFSIELELPAPSVKVIDLEFKTVGYYKI